MTRVGYEIATPADWDRLPTADGPGRSGVKAILDRQFAGRDELPLLKMNLQEELLRVLEGARSAGGVEIYLSNMAIAGYPIPTSLVISQLPGPPELASDDGIAALADQLRSMSDEQITIESTSVRNLPVGRAVRRETTVHLAGDGDQGRDSFGVQWWIPLPSTDGGLLLLAFTSPLLPLRAGLLELFDSVAQTVRWI